MKVAVKYVDYIEVIDEVELIINKDQRMVLKPIESDVNGVIDKKLQIDTVDDTISFIVSQEFTKEELRDFIQICQTILRQILN